MSGKSKIANYIEYSIICGHVVTYYLKEVNDKVINNPLTPQLQT